MRIESHELRSRINAPEARRAASRPRCPVKAISIGEQACRRGYILHGELHLLARTIHMCYVLHEIERGVPYGKEPVVPWHLLDHGMRHSNYEQARQIDEKLALVGCVRLPMTEWYEQEFVFSEEEVERLARMEHERWMNERLKAGWTYAPVRDNATKKHPDLVEWERLDETAREKDRNPVREIPAYLAAAGFMVCRKAELGHEPAPCPCMEHAQAEG